MDPLFLWLGAAYLAVNAGAVGGGWAVAEVRRRIARVRRRLAVGERLTTVRGRLRALQRVKSPMDKLDCTIAVTWFDGRRPRGSLQVITANDFLLETADGPVVVRSAGAFLHVPFAAGQVGRQPLAQDLPPDIEAALQRSPIGTSLALFFVERTFDDGVPFTVTGLSRMEQAPAELPGAGLRDLPVVRTLSAADGVLELQVAAKWLNAPMEIRRPAPPPPAAAP